MARQLQVTNRYGHKIELTKELAGNMCVLLNDKADIAVSSFTEAQMIALRDFLNQAYPLPKAKDVTTILLDVVPGPDGMGHEVYAESVEQVERRLCDLGDKLEEATERANLEASRADALVKLHNEGVK